MTDTTTLEQQARDLLERAGIENAQRFTAGDLVEIANLLGRIEVQPAPAVPASIVPKWTDAELAQGRVGIRWVRDDRVYGRPSKEDVLKYIESRWPDQPAPAAPAVPAVQIGMKASTWETLSSDAQTLILEAGQRAVDKAKAQRLADAAARGGMAQIPLDGSAAAPAVREPAIKKPIGDQAATDTSSATTAMTAGSPAINGALPLGSDAMREPHEPYLCIKPACGPDCSGCNCAISPQDMRDYAVRYAILRNAPIDAIRAGGVFAGKTPDNVVLNGEHLDAAVDALRGITGDSK